jgi:hypothetical protein
MVFNATFNNIINISNKTDRHDITESGVKRHKPKPAVFVEETGVPGENHRPAASP